jgi:hypothetical protein|tara:strand:+ start:347 stop:484 length:138 start_codon:yes stop_codon:yes gene_type:complete
MYGSWENDFEEIRNKKISKYSVNLNIFMEHHLIARIIYSNFIGEG